MLIRLLDRSFAIRLRAPLPSSSLAWILFSFRSSTGNAIMKEAADISAQIGQYKKAIEIYNQVAEWSLSSPLTKYSVKEIWLKAGLWYVLYPSRSFCLLRSVACL
jgi:hypothetical protein